MERHNAEHWICPLFVHCWEECLTLSTAEDCPQCNGYFQDGRFTKKALFDDRANMPIISERHHDQRISVHDRLGGKAFVHDRFGPIMSRELEERANNRVPDDNIFRHDPEHPLIHHCDDY